MAKRSKKEKTYLVVYLVGCDDGHVIRRMTLAEIKAAEQSGELYRDGYTVIDGEVIKSETSKKQVW